VLSRVKRLRHGSSQLRAHADTISLTVGWANRRRAASLSSPWCAGRPSMPHGIIRTLSCRLWRFIASHESDIWSFVTGMSITPIPRPWHNDAPGDPESGIAPTLADEDGCSPPPGHPEFLIPHAAPTPVERMLWAQLDEMLGP